MEAQNEKMYAKLIKILNSESTHIKKRNNSLGPTSLNVVSRRQTIRKINQDNEAFSKKLSQTGPRIVSLNDAQKHTLKTENYRRLCS